MQRARLFLLLLIAAPLLGVHGQSGPLKRTLIDSFTAPGRVGTAIPVFNRQRIYMVSADTLMLYDIVSKRFRQIGIGQWFDLAVSRNGDLLAFSRLAEGTRTPFIWTLPVNPATGLPTGPVRRASMSPGNDPAISADGRWIAFVADSGGRLTVIPAAGGRERDLLRASGHFSDITWADNDSQLFFTCLACTTPKQTSRDVVQRISASGGAPVTIDDGDVYLEGVSRDGARVVVGESSWPWREPIVLDRNGKGIAANAIDSAYVTHNTLGWLSPTQALEWGSYQLSGLMTLGIDSGTPREVIPASEEIGRVSWSPDGTRFAALHSRDKAELIISKGDGANRRVVPLPNGICCLSLAWSPDSRSIVVSGWGDGQRGRIVVVDATAGVVHAPPTSGFGLDSPHWTGDSRHLLYFSGAESDSGEVTTIHETSVDAPDRLIRTLPRRFNGNSVFASDTTAIAVSGSATYLFSLTSDRAVRLYEYQGGTPTVSPHGDLIVTRPPQRDATGGARRTAEVISLTGSHVATISFPGIIGSGVLDHFIFTPDQRSIIGTGRGADGKCCVVYQGFLDGTPTKMLVGEWSSALIAPRLTGLSLSPDGKTLLYTKAGPWIAMFKSVEVSGTAKNALHN